MAHDSMLAYPIIAEKGVPIRGELDLNATKCKNVAKPLAQIIGFFAINLISWYTPTQMTIDQKEHLRTKVDARDYEDTLILFILRLLQLQGKRYEKEYKPWDFKIEWEDDSTIKSIELDTPEVDEEYLISYLSVVRQFWAPKDALCLHHIKGILLYVARSMNDDEMTARIRNMDREFRMSSRCEYGFSFGNDEKTLTLSLDALVRFWFNTVYFHTDPSNLDVASTLIMNEAFRKWSRSHFEGYLQRLVEFARALGRETLKILWKGQLPEGKLHQLLEMFVPLERYISERAVRQHISNAPPSNQAT
jgi:hypothetical protein